jgi:hypothetical protein
MSEEQNDVKSPMTSRTILTNSAVLALLPVLKALNIEVPQELALSILPLVNILLRLVTNKAIKTG